MEAPLDSTLISNWTVALIQGVAAALRSAEQGGIVGELPFSDLIMALDPRHVPNGQTGSNIFYGKDTHWARMILKSFKLRQLLFSYVLFDDSAQVSPSCNHGCSMAKNPVEQIRFEAYAGYSCPSVNTRGLIERYMANRPPHSMLGVPTSLSINNNGCTFTVFHRPECVLASTITQPIMGDNISAELQRDLSGKTYKEVMNICYDLLHDMCEQAKRDTRKNYSDIIFLRQLEKLLRMAKNERQIQEEYEDLWTNVATTFSTRANAMLNRMGNEDIRVRASECQKYPATDVSGAFFIFFGVQRAYTLSVHFYDKHKPALIFTGSNINVGHDVVRDLTEIPSLIPKNGFASSLASDKSNQPCKRILEKYVEHTHFFRVTFMLEAATAVAIMLLTFIGPILSMYGARQWASSYRESCMQKGTSMRWAVSRVALYAGESHNDFAVYINPKRHRHWSAVGFILLTLFSSMICIVIWPFSHPQLAFPFDNFSRTICIGSSTIGILWVIVSQSIFTKSEDTDMKELKEKKELEALEALEDLERLKNLEELKTELKALKKQEMQEQKKLKKLEAQVTQEKKNLTKQEAQEQKLEPPVVGTLETQGLPTTLKMNRLMTHETQEIVELVEKEMETPETYKKREKGKRENQEKLDKLKEEKLGIQKVLSDLEKEIEDSKKKITKLQLETQETQKKLETLLENNTPEEQDLNSMTLEEKPAHFKRKLVHTVVNILLVSLLLILVETNVEKDWLYLYVLEAVYGCQWLYGELMDQWVFESTSFLMLGALSALRLTSLAGK